MTVVKGVFLEVAPFVDLVALNNGLHVSVQMEWVARSGGQSASECVEYSYKEKVQWQSINVYTAYKKKMM